MVMLVIPAPDASTRTKMKSQEKQRTPDAKPKDVIQTEDVIQWISDDPSNYDQCWRLASGDEGWRKAVSGEPLARPVLRPPVPILTVLDDGSLSTGEDRRLRGERFMIGRSEGDLVLPNDQTLSASHAEIRRVEDRGQYHWLLIDRKTSNGTFVRVNSASFFEDTVVLLGLRRFRWDAAFTKMRAGVSGGTRMLDTNGERDRVWPRLVETGKAGEGLVFEVRQSSTTIGRLGGEADIQIDDPYLASSHATIKLTAPAPPIIESKSSSNGVWVNVKVLRLGSQAFFRCGEQVFRFRVP